MRFGLSQHSFIGQFYFQDTKLRTICDHSIYACPPLTNLLLWQSCVCRLIWYTSTGGQTTWNKVISHFSSTLDCEVLCISMQSHWIFLLILLEKQPSSDIFCITKCKILTTLKYNSWYWCWISAPVQEKMQYWISVANIQIWADTCFSLSFPKKKQNKTTVSTHLN